MACHSPHLLVACLSALALCAGSVLPSALPSAAPATPNAAEQFLAAHNQARAAVVVGPLRWSPKLAASAGAVAASQQRRSRCGFADLGAGPYGANQAWASYPEIPAEAVALWVAGRQYYHHASNTCESGHECGTYTQVVWRRTAELGCAQSTCGAERDTLTICFYYPPGNFQGESPY